MLAILYKKRNPHSELAGIQIGASTMEKNVKNSQKVKSKLLI